MFLNACTGSVFAEQLIVEKEGRAVSSAECRALGASKQSVPCVPTASPNSAVCREQHRSWCSLGFVRSIALTPHMCAALSSPPWIALLMRVVEGHAPFTAASLQRQVLCGVEAQGGIRAPALPVDRCRKGGDWHSRRVQPEA